METSALKQLLKSLCNNSQWIYAVFWKIKYQNPSILTWEDGYCNGSKLENHMGSMTECRMINEREEHVSSYYGTNIHNGDSGGCSVGAAVADMFYLQYAVGEGTVGSVASSGNHSWVFLENLFTSDLLSASIYEGPTEWLLQYASGIKTILLVPVLPFGVLQLGSLQMLTENLSMVGYIKDRVSAINSVDGNATSVASDKGVWPLCASVVPSPFGSLDDPTNVTSCMFQAEKHGAMDDVKPLVSTFNQFVTNQDVPTVSRRTRPETLHSEKGHKGELEGTTMEEPFASLYQSIRDSEVEFSDLFCLEPLLPPCSQLRNNETGLFEGNPRSVHSCSVDNVVGQQFGHNLVSKKEYGSADNFFSFPDDCELLEALGSALPAHKHTNELAHDSSSSINNTTSSLMCSSDFKEGDLEHLLEAMITADDTFLNNTINARISSPVVGRSGLSAKTCCQSESSAVVVDDPALWIFPESKVTETGRKYLTSLSTSNSLVISAREENDCDITKHKNGMKSSNFRRRIKVTSNAKQRPRDRQLIQDRIKELRQIVPNGAKCSIVGLLEKTVMHMLYLQRVTDQAEKLKQLAQEGSNSEYSTVLEHEDSQPNGASWAWAFDIGSELQVCPIVVEDLEYKGHMLIKILCDDMGLFLEISQILRDLELTILKGVIERHSNNSWAHFIVETPRGFHRMDVFWPLLHLLQRKRNPVSGLDLSTRDPFLSSDTPGFTHYSEQYKGVLIQ
ncbi:transcription factor EMB1444-like isoform X2 [Cucurbita pepo subsp. pepo]|uniref:transcription factor EMB1444-like isoform X2 n=1 Tax=Cucurbita pepo subsp. pepo TaxID=3664 RepID=UPI000C9D6704|nr:transcription factor EMB1444-like isoform X2 [Cucurbita pepo subsp. pepo]